MNLKHIEQLLRLVCAISGCVSIAAFALLISFPVGITSSATALKASTISALIKKYKSVIKKERKRHNKIILLAKTKLNSIEVFFSKALIVRMN